MVKMEGFGKTWLSGLLMIAAVGVANWLLSYLNVASYMNLNPLNQVLLGILGIVLLFVVPWIYGNILKLIYEHFNLGNQLKIHNIIN
ncbi:MAG: hypothetical protein ACXVHR_10600 [Methanobacterium sp.]